MLDELLDKIEALRTKRDRMYEMFNEQIEMLGFKLEKEMKEAGLEKHNTGTCLAYFTTPKTAEVSDWEQLSKFIINNNALDLFEKRISVSALEKRIEAGEVIKGVAVKTGDAKLIIRRK